MGKITFEIGEVVQLNSGGPLMTVTDVDQDETVRVEWFLDNGQIEESWFHIMTIHRSTL